MGNQGSTLKCLFCSAKVPWPKGKKRYEVCSCGAYNGLVQLEYLYQSLMEIMQSGQQRVVDPYTIFCLWDIKYQPKGNLHHWSGKLSPAVNFANVLLTVKEFGTLFRISPQTVRRWIKEGYPTRAGTAKEPFPAKKVGREWRINIKDFENKPEVHSGNYPDQRRKRVRKSPSSNSIPHKSHKNKGGN